MAAANSRKQVWKEEIPNILRSVGTFVVYASARVVRRSIGDCNVALSGMLPVVPRGCTDCSVDYACDQIASWICTLISAVCVGGGSLLVITSRELELAISFDEYVQWMTTIHVLSLFMMISILVGLWICLMRSAYLIDVNDAPIGLADSYAVLRRLTNSLQPPLLFALGASGCVAYASNLVLHFKTNTAKSGLSWLSWAASISLNDLVAILGVACISGDILLYDIFDTTPTLPLLMIDVSTILVAVGVAVSSTSNARQGAIIGTVGLVLDTVVRIYVDGPFEWFRFLSNWLVLLSCAGVVAHLGFQSAALYFRVNVYRYAALILALGFSCLLVANTGAGLRELYLNQPSNSWGASGSTRIRRQLMTVASSHYAPAIFWSALHNEAFVSSLAVAQSDPLRGVFELFIARAHRGVVAALTFAFAAVVVDAISTDDSSIHPAPSNAMRLSSAVAMAIVLMENGSSSSLRSTIQTTFALTALVVCSSLGGTTASYSTRLADASFLLYFSTLVAFKSRTSLWVEYSNDAMRANLRNFACNICVVVLVGVVWITFTLAMERGVPSEYGILDMEGGGSPVACIVITVFAVAVAPFLALA